MTASANTANNRLPLIIISIVLLLVILVVGSIFVASWGSNGRFATGDPTTTPRGVINGELTLLAFTDLDADPFAYRDRPVRVTGRFFPQTPIACVPNKGPRPRWGLVADGLQMDAVGLQGVRTLVPEGAELTIDGIWRLYEGPLGCGKEPPTGSLWYLEAQRIYQPNPLLFDDIEILTPGIRVGNESGTPVTGETTTDPNGTATTTRDPQATPTVDTTATPTPQAQTTAVGTTIPTATATPSPTRRGEIASPTPVGGSAGTPTPTRSGGNNNPASPTPLPSATPSDGTSTPAPTATGPSGIATSPPGTVVPATLEATNTPPSYGGGGGGYP